MTLVRNMLKKLVIIALILVSCLSIVGLPVRAAAPHEDPETSTAIFSGISLFYFYSDTLDFILIKSPRDVEINTQKAPFVNVPPALNDSLINFVNSSKSICSLLLNLDGNIREIKSLLTESRYREAEPLVKEALANISLAEKNLADIEQSTRVAGAEFRVSLASANSGISMSNTAVLDRIQRLRDLLELYRSILIEQLADIFNVKKPLPTEITLSITPTKAFVGDTI